MTGPILITGASSGLGLETAVHLARNGYRVFATMRDTGKRADLDALASRHGVRIEVLPLDVTDRASIRSAVDAVFERAGGIEGLVSNAGIQIRGYFEDTSEAEIRQVHETNVLGAMAVVREVLPHMRRARRGRIVLVTSVGGRIGSHGLSAYCSSKFAVEGFGECLALEVAPLGIHVSLVEPGIVSTDIWGKNRWLAQRAKDPASPHYDWFAGSERVADWALRTSPIKPVHVAKAVEKALTDRRPRLRYLVGRRAAVLLAARGLLPGELFERLYSRLLTRMITKAKGGT
jgi:NAD(P)-dependent dehydrogenase (short-subunit alcohol dehydrogenase family)